MFTDFQVNPLMEKLFTVCSVLLVNEKQFEVVHKASIPNDLSSAIQWEIDAQIQPGAFGWAINSGYFDTILGVANSIEARDPYTKGHSRRVGQIARLIAEELNWNGEKVEFINWGGMLHDVGKIAIHDGLLNKKGKLETDEYEKMKLHPTIGAQIVEGISFLKPVVPYILEHHERFNGQGYPQGLVGEQISIEGRLLAVADVFDAMTTNRPYQKASEPEAAFKCIIAKSSELYDPYIIDAFKKVWSKGGLHEIIPPQNIL
jgi:putative nucleotidyltransferase with HDIG domain